MCNIKYQLLKYGTLHVSKVEVRCAIMRSGSFAISQHDSVLVIKSRLVRHNNESKIDFTMISEKRNHIYSTCRYQLSTNLPPFIKETSNCIGIKFIPMLREGAASIQLNYSRRLVEAVR